MPVVRVALPVPLPTLFDYLAPADGPLPAVGDRVLVPFGRRRLVGLVVERSEHSQLSPRALKPVEKVLDRGLVPAEMMGLLEWCVGYYCAPPGDRVLLALPAALRRVKAFHHAPPEYLALTAQGRRADLGRAPRQQAVRERLAGGPRSRAGLQAAGIAPEVLRRMLEKGLIEPGPVPPPESRPGPALNPAQRVAVERIEAGLGGFAALLLAGVTGSGKTEVYLAAARKVIDNGGQVLMLIPEIGLSSQLVRRIEARLGVKAWVYHSGLSEGRRMATWQAARDGSAHALVGTRSAVFLPLARAGLIVVDEEHDGSYKQQESPRYHGRDVAVMRARRLDIPVLLGSATPSLESLHNVRSGRYEQLELPRRAGQASLPGWRVHDLRGRSAAGGLTPDLLESIERRLDGDEQVLIYRNRRGYAPVLMCNECGWQGDCSRCSAHLTWHRHGGARDQRLVCHHCGHAEPVPPRCPSCRAPRLAGQGAGTERLEEILAERFPGAAIYRVDRDSMSRRDDFDRLLDKLASGEPCILVGTQMLAKGHHIPGITLAVVLDADQALYSADFRAPERLAQAVFQVSGRAGRGDKSGTFILQTRHPEHALIRQLASGSYLESAERLLDERLAAGLPPGRALALLRAEAHRPEAARAFLEQARRVLEGVDIECAGPLPAILPRRAGYWRFQLWMESDSKAGLAAALAAGQPGVHALKSASKVRWHLDVDPLEL